MDERETAELLRDLERRRLRSLVDGDMETARRHHADDYELVPPGGTRLSGADYLGGIERGDLTYEVFEPATDIRVRLTEGAAILRYQARIRIHGRDWKDEGIFWHTDYYELHDGDWRAVWSQATETTPEPSP